MIRAFCVWVSVQPLLNVFVINMCNGRGVMDLHLLLGEFTYEAPTTTALFSHEAGLGNRSHFKRDVIASWVIQHLQSSSLISLGVNSSIKVRFQGLSLRSQGDPKYPRMIRDIREMIISVSLSMGRQ